MRVLPAALLLLLAAPVRPDPTTVEEFFARLQKAQAGLETLEARFEQTKRSSLLAGEVVSQGVMHYQKPDLIRWEYVKPDPYTILIEGDHFSAYYPQLHKLKTARVARLRHRAFNFLVATEPLEKLKTHFQVEFREGGGRPTWTLVLTPLTPMIRKSIAQVTVQVDKTTALPAELFIEQADGDSTRIRFTAVTANGALPDGTFRLQVPPGTIEEPYTADNR